MQNEKANQLINEITSYVKELASETDKVKQSEFFRHYLDTMVRFWKYSYHNQLLIFYQMPKSDNGCGIQDMALYWQTGEKRQ